MTAKQVMVTGGAGFIGARLSAALLKRGYAVDIVDDLSTGFRASVPSGAELLELDLGTGRLSDRLPEKNYAAIMHLAGQSSGEKSFDDPVRDIDANARSTLALVTWALERGIPAFLHASSMGVYGQPGELPVTERCPCTPLSWYGASKLAAEHVLSVARTQGLRTCVFRMFSVYGPGQNLAELRQGMVSIYLSYLLRGEPVAVRGSLDRVRDLVYVDDVIDAWLLALESDTSGTFNLGTSVGTTVRELLDRLIAAFGLPLDYPVLERGGTPGDQQTMVADIQAARSALGWQPRVGLEAGLARMVAWARGS